MFKTLPRILSVDNNICGSVVFDAISEYLKRINKRLFNA